MTVCLLAAMTIQLQMGPADARRKSSSEVHVEQARGSIPPGAKTIDSGSKSVKGAPEGGSANANTGSSAPVTCNQQNASSPACYSATQQARPVTR